MPGPTILDTIRILAKRGRIGFSRKARLQMRERHVTEDDVLHALRGATLATSRDGNRWRASGVDLDGEVLVVALVLEDEPIVVTIARGAVP